MAIACLVLSSAAAAGEPYEKLAKLTVEQFSTKMGFRDDDLQTFALFSTERGYRKSHTTGGLLGYDSDLYLKATVDKRTKAVTYIVMANVSWVGSYAIWQRATYSTPDGPKDVDIIDGSSARVSTCLSLGCAYGGSMGVLVDEATLRTIATTNKPWRFRFVSSTGSEFENALPPVEAQALLSAVAKYQQTSTG